MLEINNTTKQKINLAKTKKIVDSWLKANKKSSYTVSLALVGAKKIKRLNSDYRGIDKATDILSFVGDSLGGNEPGEKYLGEIIINLDETKKANKYLEVFKVKKSVDYIFYFLLIHGLLHLIGYEDDKDSDRLKMLKLGGDFLKKML
ncbi:MAG: rRNA maturation RNase YbeY [Patescibacteria group bacterium]